MSQSLLMTEIEKIDFFKNDYSKKIIIKNSHFEQKLSEDPKLKHFME